MCYNNQVKDSDRLKMQYIRLLHAENAQLHAVLRLLCQLVNDMENNCSFEVFEAEWAEISLAVARLSLFFRKHQKDLQSLKDSIPEDFDGDEVDET